MASLRLFTAMYKAVQAVPFMKVAVLGVVERFGTHACAVRSDLDPVSCSVKSVLRQSSHASSVLLCEVAAATVIAGFQYSVGSVESALRHSLYAFQCLTL